MSQNVTIIISNMFKYGRSQILPSWKVINIDDLSIEFNSFVDKITELGKEKNLEIHCMHEDIFNLMHRI